MYFGKVKKNVCNKAKCHYLCERSKLADLYWVVSSLSLSSGIALNFSSQLLKHLIHVRFIA